MKKLPFGWTVKRYSTWLQRLDGREGHNLRLQDYVSKLNELGQKAARPVAFKVVYVGGQRDSATVIGTRADGSYAHSEVNLKEGRIYRYLSSYEWSDHFWPLASFEQHLATDPAYSAKDMSFFDLQERLIFFHWDWITVGNLCHDDRCSPLIQKPKKNV